MVHVCVCVCVCVSVSVCVCVYHQAEPAGVRARRALCVCLGSWDDSSSVSSGISDTIDNLSTDDINTSSSISSYANTPASSRKNLDVQVRSRIPPRLLQGPCFRPGPLPAGGGHPAVGRSIWEWEACLSHCSGLGKTMFPFRTSVS